MNLVPPEELFEVAKKNPGGWVYEIRGRFGPEEDVPASAVIGAWKVNSHGEIEGDFLPNPNFIEYSKQLTGVFHPLS